MTTSELILLLNFDTRVSIPKGRTPPVIGRKNLTRADTIPNTKELFFISKKLSLFLFNRFGLYESFSFFSILKCLIDLYSQNTSEVILVSDFLFKINKTNLPEHIRFGVYELSPEIDFFKRFNHQLSI